MDIRSIIRPTVTYQEKLNAPNKFNKSEKQSSGLQADEVVLSSKAQEFSQVLKELKNQPELREAKVKEISERIDNGTYNVDSAKIADALLNYSKM